MLSMFVMQAFSRRVTASCMELLKGAISICLVRSSSRWSVAGPLRNSVPRVS